MTEQELAERRQDEHAILNLITEVHKDVRDLNKKLTNHMTDETHELANEVAKLMAAAFPEGDPTGHRKHHEFVIKQAERRAAFWTDLAASTAKWGLVGFMGWVVYAMWRALLLGPKT